MDAAPDKADERKTVRVSIFNQSYPLVTTGDAGEVHEIANRVDELMTSIARGANADASRIAVLAALHLADELRTAQRELGRLRALTESKHRELTLLLEESLSG
jgi:cell division protein ZapA